MPRAAWEQQPDPDRASLPEQLPELPSQYLRGDYLLKVPEFPEAIWGKDAEVLLARREPLMIYGPQGSSKTTLAANYARARLGFGTDLLGLPVQPLPDDRTILLLLMDRPRQALIRFRQVLSGIPEPVLKRKVIIRAGPVNLGTESNNLLQMCTDTSAADVIIDSVKDCVVGLEKSEPAQLWNNNVQVCTMRNINVVALHHTRKGQVGNKKPNTLDDLYGSQFLSAGFGSIICLWGQPGDPVLEFLHLKQPAEIAGPRRMWVSERGTCEPYLEQDVADQIGPNGVTAEEAAQAWFGTANRASIERARRKLGRLVREGLLTEAPGTRGRGGEQSRWYLAAVRPAEEDPL